MALSGLTSEDADQVLLAYEPVWAIGEGGEPATPAYAGAIHAAIKQAVTDLLGSAPSVLYGGSVNPGNAEALAREPEIDGLFVGRAAWQPAGILALARQVAGVVGGNEALID
jgi:L-erythrulose 1-phosphate isomerase